MLTTSYTCVPLLALTACASIPADFEQVPSKSWQKPEQTPLGEFFDDYAPADPSLYGVRLLANPREAFNARFGVAALAEKSLDHRMHNKIFLADSAVAVLGGRNIGDDYFGVDEKGKLRWTAEGPDGPVVWNKEPGTSAWKRFTLRLMSWIPMEKEL